MLENVLIRANFVKEFASESDGQDRVITKKDSILFNVRINYVFEHAEKASQVVLLPTC